MGRSVEATPAAAAPVTAVRMNFLRLILFFVFIIGIE
jgi:hypothetical protein